MRNCTLIVVIALFATAIVFEFSTFYLHLSRAPEEGLLFLKRAETSSSE